ncbi:unnamed protein product [Amoebophrya sp. A120]|nr:unnamed protein product [Amoebophrya sp. A120]|eukprot:GSA120T00018882001.1
MQTTVPEPAPAARANSNPVTALPSPTGSAVPPSDSAGLPARQAEPTSDPLNASFMSNATHSSSTTAGSSASATRSMAAVQPKTRTLKKGRFMLDGNPQLLKDFIFVPDGFPTQTAEAVEQVLQTLGIKKPQLAFFFDKGHFLCPAHLLWHELVEDLNYGNTRGLLQMLLDDMKRGKVQDLTSARKLKNKLDQHGNAPGGRGGQPRRNVFSPRNNDYLTSAAGVTGYNDLDPQQQADKSSFTFQMNNAVASSVSPRVAGNQPFLAAEVSGQLFAASEVSHKNLADYVKQDRRRTRELSGDLKGMYNHHREGQHFAEDLKAIGVDAETVEQLASEGLLPEKEEEGDLVTGSSPAASPSSPTAADDDRRLARLLASPTGDTAPAQLPRAVTRPIHEVAPQVAEVSGVVLPPPQQAELSGVISDPPPRVAELSMVSPPPAKRTKPVGAAAFKRKMASFASGEQSPTSRGKVREVSGDGVDDMMDRCQQQRREPDVTNPLPNQPVTIPTAPKPPAFNSWQQNEPEVNEISMKKLPTIMEERDRQAVPAAAEPARVEALSFGPTVAQPAHQVEALSFGPLGPPKVEALSFGPTTLPPKVEALSYGPIPKAHGAFPSGLASPMDMSNQVQALSFAAQPASPYAAADSLPNAAARTPVYSPTAYKVGDLYGNNFNKPPPLDLYDEEVKHRLYLEREALEERVRTILTGIIEACAQTNSVFLLGRPSGGNRLSEILCEKLRPGCNALGCYTLDECTTIPSIVSPNVQYKWPTQREIENSMWKHNFQDPARTRIPQKVFETACVDEREEVTEVINIQSGLTEYESTCVKDGKTMLTYGGCMKNVTHVLVFATDQARKKFCELFLELFSVGLIVAGGTGPIAKLGLRCLRTGSPLFILEGTGGPADGFAELMRIYEMFFSPDALYPRASLKWIHEEIENRLTKRNPRYHFTYHHFWTFARNFDESFRHNSVMVVNLSLDNPQMKMLPVERLQDEITQVMSSVHENLGEIGNQESETRAIQHAADLFGVLLDAARNFRFAATILMTVIRVLILVSTTLALAQVWLEAAEDHHPFFMHSSDPGQDRAWAILWTRRLNVVLPLLISVLVTFSASYRPLQRFVTVFAAAKRIEGEIWRYRARVGEYVPVSVTAMSLRKRKSARENFASTVEEIWTSCGSADLRLGHFSRFLPDIFSSDRNVRSSARDVQGLQSWSNNRWSRSRSCFTDDGDDPHNSFVDPQRNTRRSFGRSNSWGMNKLGKLAGGKGAQYQDRYGYSGKNLDPHDDYGGSRREAFYFGDDQHSDHSGDSPYHHGKNQEVNKRSKFYGKMMTNTRRRGSTADFLLDDNKKPATGRSISLKFLEMDKDDENRLNAPVVTRKREFLSYKAWTEKNRGRDKLLTGGDKNSLTCSAEVYVRDRVLPQLRENERMTPKLARQLYQLQFAIIVLNASNAALVAFGAAVWVPLLLALASLLEYSVTYQALEMRLPHMNAATNTLVKLLLWWDGLTRIQQRMPESKEFLVDSAEKAILLQHDAFVTGALASLRDAIGKKQNQSNDATGAELEGNGNGQWRGNSCVQVGNSGGFKGGTGGESLNRSQRAHSM